MTHFILTLLAQEDVDEILAFIADEDPQAARMVLGRLRSAMTMLAEHPGAGHRRSDLTRSRRLRFWPVHSYLIIYMEGTRPLEIGRVLRGDRDVYALLRRR